MVYVRVRLRFDSSPLNYAKKCWFVFDADQCNLVKDVAYLIARQFDLNQGIQLYMDDFLIPVNESAQVIRDNDLIWVKAVEGDSRNTSLVLSDDVQTPKAKRKKAEKIGNQSKHTETIKTGVPCTVVPKAVNQVKTLLNSAKVVDSSSKSKPSSDKLKAVTKQSSSGALHTTFHSSSSSSSSSSEVSSSESSEPDEVPSKQKNNNMADNKKPPSNVAQNKQAQSNGVKVAPPKVDSGQRAVKAGGTRRGGRNRKKAFSNLTVGGDHDILTIKSTVYKSPVQANPKDKDSKSNHSRDLETGSSDPERREAVTAGTKESPAATTPGKKTEKLVSQWDVQPPVPVTKMSSAIEVLSPGKQTVEQPRDYSALPKLQGPPRQGDKLAFKVLELSSRYTPVVSEYKEASVLSFDPSTKVIDVEYSNETLMKLKFQSKEAGKPGRFEMQLEEEEGEQEPLVDKCDKITLDSLIEPKLIT